MKHQFIIQHPEFNNFLNFSSTEEKKPRKMAIPDEVQARLGEPVTVDGKDAEQVKEILKQLYERYLFTLIMVYS